MYGKFFKSTFTGSMYGAGPDVFALWAYVIANTSLGQIELNPAFLAPMLGTTIANAEKAIEYLASPDGNSRSKREDGRRIIKEGQFAYRVVNFDQYSNIKNQGELREYNRLAKQKSRASKGLSGVKRDVKKMSRTASISKASSPEGKQVQEEGKAATPGTLFEMPNGSPHLPPHLDTNEGRAAIETWMAYKAEHKEKLTPIGVTALMTRCGKLYTSPSEMANAIERAMASNYQGFAFDQVNGRTGYNGASAPEDARSKAEKLSMDLQFARTAEEKARLLSELNALNQTKA